MAKYVAIDAGHGGFGVTPGKRTPDGEYEWNFNNKVAKAAIAKLEANGVKVLRTDDPTGKTDVPLSTRTNKANAAKVDVFVSIHHNANTGKWGTWTGTETFTYLGNWPNAEKLAKEVHERVLKAYGLKDRGLKKADFHVIRETSMPAILVEGGYMDSTTDIKKLRDDEVLEKAGEAIADGIMAFLGVQIKKAAPKPVAPNDKLYRVRKSASDAASQKGAFRELDSAKALADKNSGYEVYDENGKCVYIPKKASSPAKETTVAKKPAVYEVEKIYGIEVKGYITIVNVSNACYICDKPSSSKSKNLGTAKKGTKLPIAGSVPGWWEVIYKGKRAYVNDKYGKLN